MPTIAPDFINKTTGTSAMSLQFCELLIILCTSDMSLQYMIICLILSTKSMLFYNAYSNLPSKFETE